MQEILYKNKNPVIRDLVDSYTNKVALEEESKKNIGLETVLSDFKNQARGVLKAPYFKKTILACAAAFSITLSYYSFLLWFPEVFQRLAQFEINFPEETATVCTVSARMFFNSSVECVFS